MIGTDGCTGIRLACRHEHVAIGLQVARHLVEPRAVQGDLFVTVVVVRRGCRVVAGGDVGHVHIALVPEKPLGYTRIDQ